MKVANLIIAIMLAAAGVGSALYTRRVRKRVGPLFDLGVSGAITKGVGESITKSIGTLFTGKPSMKSVGQAYSSTEFQAGEF